MRKAAVVGIGMFLSLGSPARAATPITNMHFDINTKADDKDKGEAINIQVIKDGTVIVYDSGWQAGDLTFRNDSHDTWDAPKAGTTIKVPVSIADCGKLKFRVEKQGSKGWIVSFRVTANDGSLVLLEDTPKVLFGKRNPVVVHNPLDGLKGVRFEHWDGGSFHEFALTCK